MDEKNGRTTNGKQIAESEKRLRALVTATSDVIYRLSADWSTLYEMDGRGFLADFPEPSTTWLETNVHPDEIPRVRMAIGTAVRNKSIFEMEHRVLRSDGSVGWTFSRAVPIIGDDGEITEWFGAASDITAQKQAEEELNASRELQESTKMLYEAVISNTPDLMYIFNLEYRFIYANSALLAMWGRTEEESIGRGLRELGYEPWHAEMHEREIDHVVATKQMIRGEVSFPHAILGRRVYDYIFSPVLNAAGEVVAVAGTTRDISDLITAQEQLKRSGEKLEQLVEERTRELKRSNDDLLQFAHVASHDLKEPVRKIRTFAGMLEQEIGGQTTAAATSYLRKIHNAAERMNSMIEGVLTYSAHSNLNQEFTGIDLNEIMRNIEADLEVSIQSRNAVIRYQDLPVVQGAPVLINQLFYNLINNSLKFAKENTDPVISISAQDQRSANANWCEIRVSDNGIGFPSEYSERIFDAFTRLNSKDAYEGTGLGLALCKKIVERHNGQIIADSETGQGASFIIRLPAV